MLESILIYWLTILNIPKGMLNEIKKNCFSFIWTKKSAKEGIPLIKWIKVAFPKNLGGWELKNVHVFSLALTTKSLWRLLYNEGL
jgi:hypothetical protein